MFLRAGPRQLSELSAPIPRSWQIVVAVLLSVLSSLTSGLTLGLMTLDVVQLEVMAESAEDSSHDPNLARQGKMARRVLAVRRDGNLVLVSLLLLNVSVNSAFSILTSELTSGLVGLLVSTTVITLFGEIIPQAVCAKYGLQAGYYLYPVVIITEFVLYVIAKPAALLLDILLGRDIGTAYSKEQLKAFLEHHERALNIIRREEMQIISGGLDFGQKKVSDCMTHIGFVFGIDINTILNFDVCSEIILSGYSRVPVFNFDKPDSIVGLFYAKDIALIDPNENLPVSSLIALYGRSIYAVDADMPLLDLLKEFKTGKTHLAVVREAVNNSTAADPHYKHIGIITLEDLLEEILQDEIYDEYEQNNATVARSVSKHSKMTNQPGNCCSRSTSLASAKQQQQPAAITNLPLVKISLPSTPPGKLVTSDSDRCAVGITPRIPGGALAGGTAAAGITPRGEPITTNAGTTAAAAILPIPSKILDPSSLSHPRSTASGTSWLTAPNAAMPSPSLCSDHPNYKGESTLRKRSSAPGRDAAAGRLRLLNRKNGGGFALSPNEAQAVSMFLAHALTAMQVPYLTPSALSSLVAECQIVTLPPKTPVFERDEPAVHVVLLLQGKLKLTIGESETIECLLGPWTILGSPAIGPIDLSKLKLTKGSTLEEAENTVHRYLTAAFSATPFVPDYTAVVASDSRPGIARSEASPARLLLITRQAYLRAVLNPIAVHLLEQSCCATALASSSNTTAGGELLATL